MAKNCSDSAQFWRQKFEFYAGISCWSRNLCQYRSEVKGWGDELVAGAVTNLKFDIDHHFDHRTKYSSIMLGETYGKGVGTYRLQLQAQKWFGEDVTPI